MKEYSSMTVMVVDDEEMLRDILTDQLELLGFAHVLTAQDGDDAIEQLNFNDTDLVICDYQMPNMNGTGVLKFIRNHPDMKHIPFIMYSGNVPMEIIAEAAETEVDAYMLKPFTLDQLRGKITQVFSAHKKHAICEKYIATGQAYRKTGNYYSSSSGQY